MLLIAATDGASTPPAEETNEAASAGTTSLLPIWTALIGAVAGIGGSFGSQAFSARRETTRLTAQNQREDAQRKREELKLLYAELIRYLGEYVTASLMYKNSKPSYSEFLAMPADTDGRDQLLAEIERQSESVRTLVEKIISTLSIIDLVGDQKVYLASLAYYDRLRKLEVEVGPANTEAATYQALMKQEMRASLTAEDTANPAAEAPEQSTPQEGGHYTYVGGALSNKPGRHSVDDDSATDNKE